MPTRIPGYVAVEGVDLILPFQPGCEDQRSTGSLQLVSLID